MTHSAMSHQGRNELHVCPVLGQCDKFGKYLYDLNLSFLTFVSIFEKVRSTGSYYSEFLKVHDLISPKDASLLFSISKRLGSWCHLQTDIFVKLITIYDIKNMLPKIEHICIYMFMFISILPIHLCRKEYFNFIIEMERCTVHEYRKKRKQTV